MAMDAGSAAETRGSVHFDLGALSVEVPATTPPDAVRTIEDLFSLIDTLADRTAQLHVALSSRIVIEQAKGMLAERHGITPNEAFELLRAAARRRRTKIHALARAVVERRADTGII